MLFCHCIINTIQLDNVMSIFRNTFTQIIYSINNNKSDLISTSIFVVDRGVLEFITYLLKNINYYYSLFYNTIERHEQGLVKGTELFTQLLFKKTNNFIQGNKPKNYIFELMQSVMMEVRAQPFSFRTS